MCYGHRARTVRVMVKLNMVKLKLSNTLIALALVGAGCSAETVETIANEAVQFGGDTAVLVAAEAIGAQLQSKLDGDGKIPAGAVNSVLQAYDTVATVSAPDADGDGFIDGNRIQISLGESNACLRFEAGKSSVSKGAC